MKDHMCDFLPPKMSDRTTDLEASLTSMDWLPKLNVRDISEKAKNEKDEKSKKKTNGDADNDSHSKDGKPPYSYANLITLAINSSKSRKMTLSEIYSWICENFPYYQDIGTGWKNSIRHNLSLNKCFMKVARTKNDPGKGSYWAIDSSPQDEPIPFKRKRHTDEMLRHDESSSCTSFNSSSGSPSFATSAQHYSAMTSPEHAGSPSHHSTPLNHFHSQPLPHNDHNNNQNVDVGINLANLPLTDLSASFKSFYRSVIEPTSQGFSRSNASIVSNDPAVNHSYNSSCSSQSFNNSNSHSHADHRRHHVNHISPLAQTHHHNMTPQQIHLNSSTESERMMRSPRTHYTRSRAHDMNNSVTLNQVNKSVNSASSSGFNFDLSNIESLKNSFMSVNWPDIDLNQFPDFLETMQRADSNDWELDQQTAIDLCSSLSRVFQQSGYGQQQYHQHHPSSSSISTSSSIGDTSCHMNRSYIAQPQISPQQQHLSRSIPISPPHAVSGDMRHMQTRSLSGSAPPPTSSPSMMQQNSMIPPPGYIQPPQQQSQQDDIPDTFDWDSIC